MLAPLKDWDDAFANMAHIPGSEALPEKWQTQAATYRASGVKVDTDIPYGGAARTRFDMVWPDGTPKGLAVFVHGGYWMRTDKSFWTDLAEGARAAGWAVCLPSYTLAPEARITQMTGEVAAAITAAAARVAGPIRLAGHSAGGHLATRMICDDTALPPEVLGRIGKTVAISGVHDLRPLLQTKMHDVLHLDQAEARQQSPVLHGPATDAPFTCWVGGGERPEFVRQSQLLALMWDGLDIPSDCVVDGDHDHFTVVDALRDQDSPLVRSWLGDFA